jgi:hypothetical protein
LHTSLSAQRIFDCLPLHVRPQAHVIPGTAPIGIRVAGLGMLAAVAASFLYVFTVDAAAGRT